MENLIVQKFSGKVMQDVTTRQLAIRQVKEVLATGHRVIAVVSAPKGPAQPYATASLEKLVGGDFSALQPRELAQLVGTGEVIAMSLMVNEMRQQGLNVVGLTGPQAGIYTNEHYQKAQIARLDKQPIEQAFAAAAQVVVVAGFQGQNAAGQLTTLEVGGSDITAAVLAAASLAAGVAAAQVDEVLADALVVALESPVHSGRKLKSIFTALDGEFVSRF